MTSSPGAPPPPAHPAFPVVLECLPAVPARGLWGLFERTGEIEVPRVDPNARLFLHTESTEGPPTLLDVSPSPRPSRLAGSRHSVWLTVHPRTWDGQLTFPHPASPGTEVGSSPQEDLVLRGRLRLVHPRQFLEQGGADLATPGVPLTPASILAWCARHLRSRVQEVLAAELKRRSPADLIRLEVLPAPWWNVQLEGWLAPLGVHFGVTDVIWLSPEAERQAALEEEAAALDRQQAELAARRTRERAHQEALHAGELAEQELQAQHEARIRELEHQRTLVAATTHAQTAHQLAELEHDLQVARATRDHELRTLEERHRQELTRLEAETQQITCALQLTTVEHQAALDRIARTLETEARDRAEHTARRQTEARHAEALTSLEHRQSLLAAQNRIAEAQYARLATAQQHARETQQRSLEAQLATQRLREEILTQSRLSAAEREHRLGLLEIQHRHEQLAAETELARLELEIVQARHAIELAEKDQAIALAERDRQLEALRHTQAHEDRLTQQYRAKLAQLAETEKHPRAETLQLARFFALLSSPNPTEAHQAAEWLHYHGFPAATLAALGYTLTPLQRLRARLETCALARPGQVVLTNTRIRTRSATQLAAALQPDQSAVTAAAQDLLHRNASRSPASPTMRSPLSSTPTLALKESLQLQLASRSPGYLTLLNLGTDGKVVLQVPNTFTGTAPPRIEAGLTYTIPGPEFLPAQRIRGYYENGPAGWEHVAAVISDAPVLPAPWSARSTPHDPLVELAPDEINHLEAMLGQLPNGTWQAGLLTFLVT